MSAPSIVDAVWGTRPPARAQPAGIAALIAASLYAAIAVATWRAGPPLDGWALIMAARVHHDLTRLESVDVAPPEPEPEPDRPPPPEPVPEDTPPPSAPAPETSTPPPPRAPRRAPSSRPSPPAKAGRVLDSGSEAPVDLTGIVTGDGPRYAGGSTARGGTAEAPVSPALRPAAPKPAAPKPATPSRARPPTPLEGDWDCAWPAAADRLEINAAAATVRVTVDARGRPVKVNVTRDPGHGFADAAIRCATRARFQPARDARGEPVQAVTPPIRVRFTR